MLPRGPLALLGRGARGERGHGRDVGVDDVLLADEADVGVLEERELPDQRRSVEAPDQAVVGEDRVDVRCAMQIRPKGRPRQAEPEVDQRDGDPTEECVPRVDEAVAAFGESSRPTDEGRHIRVAADDAVERDDVGGFDDVGECHEVADAVVDSISVTLSRRLLAGGRDVRARGVHVHRRIGPRPQKLVVDRADAATDIEDRLALDASSRQGLDQGPGQAGGSVATVFTQIVFSVTGVELAIVCAAVHAADPSSRS